MASNNPARIGKYDVLDVLGRGGMGVVYRARDARLGRIVAVKMLTEGFAGAPDMLRRFYEEANRHAALQHNNIVIVFDAGDQDGEPYIVMEFVEGKGLDKIIKEERAAPAGGCIVGCRAGLPRARLRSSQGRYSSRCKAGECDRAKKRNGQVA